MRSFLAGLQAFSMFVLVIALLRDHYVLAILAAAAAAGLLAALLRD